MNTVLKGVEFLSMFSPKSRGCFYLARTIQEKARRNDGTRTSSSRKCSSKKMRELRNRGFWVNHKRIQRLMKALGLSARIVVNVSIIHTKGRGWYESRESHSRQFKASKPMEKCYTDVTGLPFRQAAKTLFITSFRWF